MTKIKKVIFALCIIAAGFETQAQNSDELRGWYVVQVAFNSPLILNAEVFRDNIDYVKYFADGTAFQIAPPQTSFGKNNSIIMAFTSPSCRILGKADLHVSQKRMLTHQIKEFFGYNEEYIYPRNSQVTSVRVIYELGIFTANFDIGGGLILCSSKEPFTQELLDTIFGKEASVKVLRPCRYDDVGNGLQERVCE